MENTMSDIDNDILNNFEVVGEPSYTYRMVLPTRENEPVIFRGKVDELEAVKQAVYKILNTERCAHIIYSWNYGIELISLFGQPIPWVYPELERRITEALVWDDRINSVTDFEFENVKNEVHAKFTVNTIYGSYDETLTVAI